MGCGRIDGGFMCGPGIKPCEICGRVVGYLCDYPIGGGKTCDMELCEDCANVVGEEMDFCPVHYAEFKGKAKVGDKSNVTRIEKVRF